MKTIATKIIASVLAIAALSSLSGCIVDTRPYPARGGYYGPVVVARPVVLRRY